MTSIDRMRTSIPLWGTQFASREEPVMLAAGDEPR